MEFRHEWKHEISYGDMCILRQRLGAVMRPDSHARDGRYAIRSLYFDNAADQALREKLDGVNNREKFRIRYYNHDPAFLRLEKKSKRNGLSSKVSVQLTASEAQAVVDGDWEWMRDTDRPLVRELHCKMQLQGLRPKTVVDYIREPFVSDPGTVRVTMDYDIRTGLRCTDFLNPCCVTIPAGAAAIILEVKWDAFLPTIIRDIVQLEARHTSAFSKYASCRIYD